VGGRVVDLRTPHGHHEDVFVSLHGAHQGDNAATAVAAVEAFFDDRLPDDVVAEALGGVVVPGRFEIMGRNPLVVIDAAHNPEGARSARETMTEGFGEGRGRVVVVGLLGGRDIGEVLDALGAADADLVICCSARSPRAIPAEDIAAVGRAQGMAVEVVPDVADAIGRALAVAGEEDVVLVTGSFYVVGEARRILAARD
jgi:dihydrofolate synthase/folylpolyglutamate synthase